MVGVYLSSAISFAAADSCTCPSASCAAAELRVRALLLVALAAEADDWRSAPVDTRSEAARTGVAWAVASRALAGCSQSV